MIDTTNVGSKPTPPPIAKVSNDGAGAVVGQANELPAENHPKTPSLSHQELLDSAGQPTQDNGDPPRPSPAIPLQAAAPAVPPQPDPAMLFNELEASIGRSKRAVDNLRTLIPGTAYGRLMAMLDQIGQVAGEVRQAA